MCGTSRSEEASSSKIPTRLISGSDQRRSYRSHLPGVFSRYWRQKTVNPVSDRSHHCFPTSQSKNCTGRRPECVKGINFGKNSSQGPLRTSLRSLPSHSGIEPSAFPSALVKFCWVSS